MERKWWTLLASCIAIFMLLLEVTIVNVALPSIERELGANLRSLQWVLDAYLVTLTAEAGAFRSQIPAQDRLVSSWRWT